MTANKATDNKQKILFGTRICLWIIALASTIYWMYFSAKLHAEGIFDYEEYATTLRPVLYTCLIIAVVAICISFALRALGKKLV